MLCAKYFKNISRECTGDSFADVLCTPCDQSNVVSHAELGEWIEWHEKTPAFMV